MSDYMHALVRSYGEARASKENDVNHERYYALIQAINKLEDERDELLKRLQENNVENLANLEAMQKSVETIDFWKAECAKADNRRDEMHQKLADICVKLGFNGSETLSDPLVYTYLISQTKRNADSWKQVHVLLDKLHDKRDMLTFEKDPETLTTFIELETVTSSIGMAYKANLVQAQGNSWQEALMKITEKITNASN